jgi:hypothetical protein
MSILHRKPQNLHEAMDQLVKNLSESEKTKIREMSEEDFLWFGNLNISFK